MTTPLKVGWGSVACASLSPLDSTRLMLHSLTEKHCSAVHWTVDRTNGDRKEGRKDRYFFNPRLVSYGAPAISLVVE